MTDYKRTFRFVVYGEQKKIAEEMLNSQGFSWVEQSIFADCSEFKMCRLVEEPFALGSSLAAFFGLIYIQDSSSMLPPVALNPPRGSFVLDMCSSPGSKTGQLAGLLGYDGFVLGNEISTSRLATLRKNLQQMNAIQAGTCCYEGQKIPLPSECFDYIQLDPPCSGWGTVERNPNVREMWKDEKIIPLIRLQKQLLQEAYRLLRPGGVVVYSTCTTNVDENEKQVIYAIEELGLTLESLPALPEFELEEPLLACQGVWRLLPKKKENQGFFVAKMHKKCIPTKEYSIEKFESNLSELTTWGQCLSKGILEEFGLNSEILKHGDVSKFNNSLHFVPSLARKLPSKFSWQGMYLGKVSKGGELQISPRFRIFDNLEHLAFFGVKGIEQIRALLNGQSINSDFKGKFAMLSWNGLPLGRAKVKNKRILWTER